MTSVDQYIINFNISRKRCLLKLGLKCFRWHLKFIVFEFIRNRYMLSCRVESVYVPVGLFIAAPRRRLKSHTETMRKQLTHKQRVLMLGHQGWNVGHGLCHIYMRYVYIWVGYSFGLFCCLFIVVMWWDVWCIEWASGNQGEVQACLVTWWLFIISCCSLYKTTLGLLCSWFEKNPYFHKYDFSCLMCLLGLNFYEKYDWINYSMIKCKSKKVNNWTTATYALMGAFDYTTNG